MDDNMIEISQELRISAAIHFWVDRDEWNALSAAEKRAKLEDAAQTAAIRCDNDTIVCSASVNMSATIPGISEDEFTVYDPAD
jgi:hypothetical protein